MSNLDCDCCKKHVESTEPIDVVDSGPCETLFLCPDCHGTYVCTACGEYYDPAKFPNHKFKETKHWSHVCEFCADNDEPLEENGEGIRVGRGDFHPVWKGPTWHVFNGKCQIAGPYKTKEEAETVMKAFNAAEAEWKAKPNDIEVTDGGSIYVVNMITQAARDWVGENVSFEEWQRVGVCGFSVEARLLPIVLEGMAEAGLKIGGVETPT